VKRSAIVLFILAAVVPTATPQPAALRKGMTRDEVKAAFGPPHHVSRQLLFRRHLEQWHYVDPPRTVEFNCVRGEEPYLLQFRPERRN
jgi:hypothetical protein